MKIEEAKQKLEAYLTCESRKAHCNCGDECDDNCHLLYDMGTVGEHNEAVNVAIRSLEAWEKVKEEIDALYDGMIPTWATSGEVIMSIIEKHLQEVAEDDNSK